MRKYTCKHCGGRHPANRCEEINKKPMEETDIPTPFTANTRTILELIGLLQDELFPVLQERDALREEVQELRALKEEYTDFLRVVERARKEHFVREPLKVKMEGGEVKNVMVEISREVGE